MCSSQGEQRLLRLTTRYEPESLMSMAMQKVHVGAILAIAMTGIVASVLATSLLVANQRFPNSGLVKAVGVGVYWDSAFTSNVTSIDWGYLTPGSTANRTVYIKNNGDIREMLNMTTSNWSSGAYGKITLTWDREGQVLDPGSSVQAVLTLSVSSNISSVTSFSFNIIIAGTEHP
jgi:hypothetical protein